MHRNLISDAMAAVEWCRAGSLGFAAVIRSAASNYFSGPESDIVLRLTDLNFREDSSNAVGWMNERLSKSPISSDTNLLFFGISEPSKTQLYDIYFYGVSDYYPDKLQNLGQFKQTYAFQEGLNSEVLHTIGTFFSEELIKPAKRKGKLIESQRASSVLVFFMIYAYSLYLVEQTCSLSAISKSVGMDPTYVGLGYDDLDVIGLLSKGSYLHKQRKKT